MNIDQIKQLHAAMQVIRTERVQGALRAGLRRGAEFMLARARSYAPVRTGNLRNSLRIKDSGAQHALRDLSALSVTCDMNYFTKWNKPWSYAHWQEVGTRFMPGKHFMSRAAADTARNWSHNWDGAIALIAW